MKRAILFRIISCKKVQCIACERKCIIDENKKGWCKTRVNIGGRLFSLIHGEVASISINPIEKKPVFHFLPGSRWLSIGSLGCNFRCPGCQNWELAHSDIEEGLKYTRYLSGEDLISIALDRGCQGISWTFNEPGIWAEYILEGAKLARLKGLYTNVVTNGFWTNDTLKMLGPLIDVFRVDIKGFTKNAYSRLAGIEDFQSILQRTMEAKMDFNCHVEVVTNVIPGINDSMEDLTGIAKWISSYLGKDTPWHLTRFYPSHNWSNLRPTSIETLEKAMDMAKREGLHFVYIGNVPGHKGENTYCPECGAILIQRYVFEVMENNVKEGRCPDCNFKIEGKF
jgi:pyruvate formate lyase activating enzyme